jgi:hypothetical protein
LTQKWALWFTVEGDERFLSHHDMMRLMERAVARAGLPVKHSQGFNPRPRLSLTLPRPVGVASRSDLLVIDLDEPMPAADIAGRMSAQLPGGMAVAKVEPLAGTRQPQVLGTTYEIALTEAERATVGAVLAKLGAAPAVGAPAAAPALALAAASLADVKLEGDTLTFTLVAGAKGPGKPAWALAELGVLSRAAVTAPVATDATETDAESADAAPAERPADEPDLGDVFARLVRTAVTLTAPQPNSDRPDTGGPTDTEQGSV